MAFKVEHDVMYNVNEETPHDINVSTASYEVSGISGTDEERRNTSPLFQSHELSSDWTDDEQSEDASSNLPPKKLKKAWEDDGTSAEKERGQYKNLNCYYLKCNVLRLYIFEPMKSVTKMPLKNVSRGFFQQILS